MKTMPMSFLFSWLPPIFMCSSLVAATGKNNSKRAAFRKLRQRGLCVESRGNSPFTLFNCPAFLIVRWVWLY